MKRLLILLFALLLASPAEARSFWTYPEQLNSSHPHPLSFSPDEEPDWLKSELKRIHRHWGLGHKLEQHLLFKRWGEATWLAVEISSPYDENVAIYQVVHPANTSPQLRLTKVIMQQFVSISDISGSDAFGDGVPFLEIASGGGSGRWNYRVHLFRLGVEAQDVSPPGAIYSEDIAHDGRAQVIGLNPNSSAVFPQCDAQCQTLTPIIYRWSEGRFITACQDYPDYYQNGIYAGGKATRASKKAEAEKKEQIASYLPAAIGYALDMLQSGEITPARKELNAILARAQRLARDELDQKALALARSFYPPIFAQAKTSDACPYSDNLR